MFSIHVPAAEGTHEAYNGPLDQAHTVLPVGEYAATTTYGDELAIYVLEPIERAGLAARTAMVGSFVPGRTVVLDNIAYRRTPYGYLTAVRLDIDGEAPWAFERALLDPAGHTAPGAPRGLGNVLDAVSRLLILAGAHAPGRVVPVNTVPVHPEPMVHTNADDEIVQMRCPYGCDGAGATSFYEVDRSTRWNGAAVGFPDSLDIDAADAEHHTIGHLTGCCERVVIMPERVESVWG